MNLTGYELSKDHRALFELMKTQTVICVCAYTPGHSRDVCRTMYQQERDGWERFQASARGIGYIDACDLAEFIRQCEASNLEFIVPKS